MEKFLEKLEAQLTMLEVSEQKKIIKRYQNEINEKIKSGMSEKEAIKSLGRMDDIVFQIYEEYHLDKKNIGKTATVGEKVERILRKCAKFLADTCTETAYYLNHISNNALETFFEVFLKIVVFCIFALLLKLPFIWLEGCIQYLLNFLFYPFDRVLLNISSFTIAVIYFIVCVALILFLFKGYAKKDNKDKTKAINKVKIESSEQSRNYAYALLKVGLYIVCIIPMIFIVLGLLVLTALSLFIVYKGVSVIGLVVILVGLLFLSIIITTYITDALDNRSRSHTFAIVVTVIALISGSILFVDNLMNFDYPKKLEDSAFVPYEETTTFNIEKETEVVNLSGDLEYVVDNSIEDNVILVKSLYFDELYDVMIEHDSDRIWFYTLRDDFEMDDIHYLYQNVLKDLQNNKIYNYHKLDTVDIVLYGNENTEKLLTLEK